MSIGATSATRFPTVHQPITRFCLPSLLKHFDGCNIAPLSVPGPVEASADCFHLTSHRSGSASVEASDPGHGRAVAICAIPDRVGVAIDYQPLGKFFPPE
jgi:hypothetical protein